MPSNPDVLQCEALAEQIADLPLNWMRDEAMMSCDALLSENRLARLQSVSRRVVRDGLMRLKLLGLISMESGRPPVVEAMDTRELLEARRGLEIRSAIIAARKTGSEDRARLLGLALIMKVKCGGRPWLRTIK